MDPIENIIVKPLITEKATLSKMQSTYVFAVKIDATKIDVRRAVEKLFKVKVKDVNTVSVRGKTRRMGKGSGTTARWKKAYVKVQDGQKIDLIEGML